MVEGTISANVRLAVIVSDSPFPHLPSPLQPNGKEQDMYIVGAACSEVFSGNRLAKVLKRGHELEADALDAMSHGRSSPCLSIHTSAGIPSALSEFLDDLKKHLPRTWTSSRDDWFVSLQMEGASAVWAAIDLLWQMQRERGELNRTRIAVGEYSYHGPPSSSYGRGTPLGPRENQITYPVPVQFSNQAVVSSDVFRESFDQWLDQNGDEIAVMLVEPQWGSSVAAQPWDPDDLRYVVKQAQDRGIYVCADEIMCGLFRHGKRNMFLSDAWNVDPDAVTFGKSIAAGIFPLSGVAVREGGQTLRLAKRSVMQSHTYAGSSVRALMTGTAVLEELPRWCDHVTKMETILECGFRDLQDASNGALLCRGHGMMWGAVMDSSIDEHERSHALELLKSRCMIDGAWPYFIPVGGIMVTPVLDVQEEHLQDALSRLISSVAFMRSEMGW